ncbi:MAG: hypothetical protein IT373_13635 [Polyangiaceae bacterium]|nr:hypothetical protein [Polyangiaceae bacterium]
MSSDPRNGPDTRAMLHLPAKFDLPDPEKIVEDARAILLHSLSLRKEIEASGMVLSPVWEEDGGHTAVRAAVVPPEVAKRHFEGPGMASLRDAGVMDMLADIVLMLLEAPDNAAHVLEGTYRLWLSEDAPVRSLEVPFRPHFKVLTLVVADLTRKVGAGFSELEWIASLGLLDAFHDPASDPPRAEVLASTRRKTAAMCAEEEAWMHALVAQA